VIDAGAKAALEWQQKNGEGLIGVFATVGTVASNGYPRTLFALAKTMGIKEPLVFSHGGLGLAESIDRDWDYFVDTLHQTRAAYKGPSVKNKNYTIDTTLLPIYNFSKASNKLLCEYDDKGSCLDIQLNDPSNYVRYHLVSLLEGLLKNSQGKKMNTLILGCTHYPFMKDSIRNVLNEMYEYKTNGKYRYREVLASHVELIDPSVETAKEAYKTLMKMQLANASKKEKMQFFISVPNTALKEIALQPDGWFTYQYKYGRIAGENKEYVRVVPFDQKNISAATYNRFKEALPKVYAAIQKASQ
jgi:glutamate racemase